MVVTDDEASSSEVTLTADPESVREGEGAMPVVVTAMLNSGAFKEALTISVTVTAGANTETADFAAGADFMLTIPAQMASGTATFTLMAIDDRLWEPETESVTVGGVVSGLTVNGTGVALMDNDNEPELSFRALMLEMMETGGSVELVVSITNRVGFETAQPVTLDFNAGTPQVGRATRGADYTVAPSDDRLVLDAGDVSASATATLTAVHDTQDEDEGLADRSDDESVVVSAMHGSTPLGTVEVAILDDDDPEVTVSYDKPRYEVSEAGETSDVVMVLVSANPEREIVVGLTQVPGVGVPPTDYTTTLPTMVTFSASNHAPRNFTVTAMDDRH